MRPPYVGWKASCVDPIVVPKPIPALRYTFPSTPVPLGDCIAFPSCWIVAVAVVAVAVVLIFVVPPVVVVVSFSVVPPSEPQDPSVLFLRPVAVVVVVADVGVGDEDDAVVRASD